jgi:hypothetical protein
LLDRFRKDLTVCHSLILRNTAFTECLFLARFELIIMAVSHYEGGNMHFEKIQYFLIHFAAGATPARQLWATLLSITLKNLS